MATYNVSGATQLRSALNSAKGGDMIRLAAGNYGKLDLTNKKFSGNVTITSASDSNKATFTSVAGSNVANLTLDSLNFAGGDWGVRITRTSNIKVTDSTFTNLNSGLKFQTATNITVHNNYFTKMKVDAMNFCGVTNAVIQNNKYTESGSLAGYTHKDFIQFYAFSSRIIDGAGPSKNIKIIGNQFYSKDNLTHGIFFMNGEKNIGKHQNILIQNNYFKSSHTLGMGIDEASYLTIQNNTLVRDGKLWPLINVTPTCTYVKIIGNTAPSVPDQGNSTWLVANNKETATGSVTHWTLGLTGQHITNAGTTSGANSVTEPSTPSDPTPSDPAPSTGVTKTGTSGADTLQGTNVANTLIGQGGNDRLWAEGGNDVLRGQDGSDRLVGAQGADVLIGGKGGDTFVFKSVADSTSGARDGIQEGDGAIAFEGVGSAAGDRIDLVEIDADTTVGGNQGFKFGGAGKGTVSVVDVGSDTLVRANTDADGDFEFQILIKDASVKASAYSAADFFL